SAIVAYNYPNQLALAKLAPALAAGCTVVLKGAPDTPLVTLAIGEIIARHTDIPAGVVNVLTSSDPAIGVVMTTHDDVDMITFTGSTATGKRIMSAASETVKKVFLELGGKSAMIMLDDLDTAGLGLPAMFAALSQSSLAGHGRALPSRLLVPRDRHDELVATLASNFSNIACGAPAHRHAFSGPVISAPQGAKVDGMVQ